ncbi:MAG: hypothetical protein NTW28_18965, partial [Candidatus Solibacter sp.]|nr:hypothetical protein [Candidatus Solibacter sp.]
AGAAGEAAHRVEAEGAVSAAAAGRESAAPSPPVGQAAQPAALSHAKTSITEDGFLHVARTVARLEPLLHRGAGRTPEPARAAPPRVHIGTVEIVVAAPPAPAAAPDPAPSGFASRRYLRRF